MPKYTVSGEYANYHELVIEAPDEDTAMQIFYQNGGGEPIDGAGWSKLSVEFMSWAEPDTHEEPEAEYTMDDYDPERGKISWRR